MATLPQITLNFNHQIKLSNDGGSLSSDTVGLLYRGFDEKLGVKLFSSEKKLELGPFDCAN